jgi:hypothetical protein
MTPIYGQDTIILCKKKNQKKDIIIPSDHYEVKVKPIKQKKLHARLTSATDSTITMRVGTRFTKKRKVLKREHIELLKTPNLSQEQIDSVLILKAYPEQKTLKLSEVNYIVFYNFFDSPKFSKFYNILGIVIGASWLSLITNVAFKGSTDLDTIMYMTIVGETVTLTLGLINRKIFLDKWTIKIINNNR